MHDLDKLYRLSIFNCLSGITVTGITSGATPISVYDEVKKIDSTDSLFIVLLGQKSTPNPIADGLWGRLSTIEISITHKTGVSVTKDLIDNVAEEVMKKLFPTALTFGPTEPQGFQYCNPMYESGFITPIQISSTESVMAKILAVSTTIIQY